LFESGKDWKKAPLLALIFLACFSILSATFSCRGLRKSRLGVILDMPRHPADTFSIAG
jgi:hypothetical protein